MRASQFSKERVFIAIGSNKGNRLKNIKGAIYGIGKVPGTEVCKVAKVYQSSPIGPSKGKFLNTVIQVYTNCSPFELLVALKEIEERLGRTPGPRWGDRTIDLDILLFGDLVMETDLLRIPHPELHKRDFVLLPLIDIDPEVVHPVLGVSVGRLASSATIHSNCTVKYKSLEQLPS